MAKGFETEVKVHLE